MIVIRLHIVYTVNAVNTPSFTRILPLLEPLDHASPVEFWFCAADHAYEDLEYAS